MAQQRLQGLRLLDAPGLYEEGLRREAGPLQERGKDLPKGRQPARVPVLLQHPPDALLPVPGVLGDAVVGGVDDGLELLVGGALHKLGEGAKNASASRQRSRFSPGLRSASNSGTNGQRSPWCWSLIMFPLLMLVVNRPGAQTGRWPACGRRHDTDLEAEVVGFELAGERGHRRRRNAAQVLDVGTASYLPCGGDVLGEGTFWVGRGVEPYQLVVGQAGCGVFGRARGCARLRCVHRCLLLGRVPGSANSCGAIYVVNDRILAVIL